jgi:cytochrome c
VHANGDVYDKAARKMGNRLGFCGALLVAQMLLPSAKPTEGATLFKQQCATCHFTKLSEPVRQGPSLFRIVGRPAGKVDDFHYSAAKADFARDDARLDAWLADPEAIIPGALVAYRQPKAETRAAITYLKELN